MLGHGMSRHPLHVTLRLRANVPAIARAWLMPMIRAAIKDSQKVEFRIVEFNVLSNHLHLMGEASSTLWLSRGVQGLAGRLALRLNKKFERTGKVFATRFHARSLTTPRDVRNTLRYVLLDRKHHDPVTRFDRHWIDPTRAVLGSLAGRARFAASKTSSRNQLPRPEPRHGC
ncbi:hypothetical protein BH11MYX1_BH11MYX1_47150 [soil metagenome]